jgi:hypothetical protein
MCQTLCLVSILIRCVYFFFIGKITNERPPKTDHQLLKIPLVTLYSEFENLLATHKRFLYLLSESARDKLPEIFAFFIRHSAVGSLSICVRRNGAGGRILQSAAVNSMLHRALKKVRTFFSSYVRKRCA